jgi:hypothetical protein
LDEYSLTAWHEGKEIGSGWMANKTFSVGGGNCDLIAVGMLAGFSQRQVWHLAGQGVDDLALLHCLAQEKFFAMQV